MALKKIDGLLVGALNRQRMRTVSDPATGETLGAVGEIADKDVPNDPGFARIKELHEATADPAAAQRAAAAAKLREQPTETPEDDESLFDGETAEEADE